MLRLLGPLLSLAALLACAPPPLPSSDEVSDDSDEPVVAEPSINILFPESGPEMVYCDKFMVVVDIDNYVLNPGFYDGELDLVEGEGHWHLNIPAGLGGDVVASGVPYAFVDVSEALPNGGTYAFTAQIVDNQRAPRNEVPVSVVEIVVDGTYDPDEDGMLDCIGGSGTGTGY